MPPRKKTSSDTNPEQTNPETEKTEGAEKKTTRTTRSRKTEDNQKAEDSTANKTESSEEKTPTQIAAERRTAETDAPAPPDQPISTSRVERVEQSTAGAGAEGEAVAAPEPPAATAAETAPVVAESATPAPGDTGTRPTFGEMRYDVSFLTDDDIFYFNEGTHFRLYNKLGAHMTTAPDGTPGTHFAVWAPNAETVAVIGDFNYWDKTSHPLQPRGDSGIWEGFLPTLSGSARGQIYKYFIASRFGGYQAEKADPFALSSEEPPRTASAIWDLEYEWGDEKWMETRAEQNSLEKAISVYEVHLGSWMRVPEDNNRWLTYRELAERLPQYCADLGFTHVEFLPVMEHPFYGSWGYQTTGYFAPTRRYGGPQDFMYLVDKLHQHGIGVILDWVPSHFPSDAHGLGYFDGTHLFEHFYPQKGWHPDWQSYIFNYGRHEVRSFLISSALFWFDKYHIDGLRVDAVASMLYLDYSRKEGEWMANEYGGNENIEAIWFLRRMNEEIYKHYPDVQTMAEESTSWSMVSRPTYVGGLGFGMKWDMGWMHDTLSYMSREPIHRRHHHSDLSFRMLYAFHENFCLPLSHDEVVHGKRSLIDKMPGDMWQKNANLRALFGYMYAQPGKKLIFQGGEIAQWNEWYHEASVDWHLLRWDDHKGIQRWIADLNKFYQTEPAMHELDNDPSGFQWIDIHDWQQSTVSLLRKGKNTNAIVTIVCNFTPVPRESHRVGVPLQGYWREALNSDAREYAGSGMGNAGGVMTEPIESHGLPFSIKIVLPPLSVLFFVHPGEES